LHGLNASALNKVFFCEEELGRERLQKMLSVGWAKKV